MGRQSRTSNRFVRTKDLTLAASAARTATGVGSSLNSEDIRSASVLLDVTARSGTSPTLDVVVQTSYDGTTWRTVGTFTQATNTGSQRISAPGLDRYVRASWTIGGTTPSFTFAVTAEGK